MPVTYLENHVTVTMNKLKSYWRRNLLYLLILLIVWFAASYYRHIEPSHLHQDYIPTSIIPLDGEKVLGYNGFKYLINLIL